MNRHDHPAHPGTAAPVESTTEEGFDTLLAEDVRTEEWDASHLPDFSA
ncbi:MAG: hypothetical protein AB1450_02410 [Pseudomonadota bacterium]